MINAKAIKKYSVLQHDSSDCGVACLVSVINYLGGFSTIGKIRSLSGTGQSGTTMLGLYQAAVQCGVDATGYEAAIPEIIDYKGILILHVTIENGLEHFIVSFGYENNNFVIWDPAKGLEFVNISDLEKIWISKKCLGLKPNESFKFEKENKSEKRSWLLNIIRPDSNLLFISIFIGILMSALSLVMAIFTQKLIDKILPSKDIKLLTITLFLVFILLCARIVFSSIRQMILLSQGRSFNIRIVDDFFGSLLLLPKSFFDTRKTGDFVGRLNDTIRIQRVITEFASAYIIDILVVIISLVILFFYSETAAFFTLLTLPVFFTLVYQWNSKIISAQREVMSKYAQSESNYIDSLRGITEIKSLNWQKLYKEKNRIVFSEFQDKSFFLGKIKVKLGLITGLAGTLYLILVLLYTSIGVINSWMTQGELLAILSICSNILPSVLNLALVAIPLSEAKVAMSRMFEFTQIDPEGPAANSVGSEIRFEKIKLDNISFRFPGRKLLLRDINISMEKGLVVSLVGESGGGKSTLVNIIMGFYVAESGKIIVNDIIDSEEISIKNWRSSIGIIPQEIHIFNGTILQNLLTEYSEDKIKELLSMITEYGLGPFFDSFPGGLNTLVGEEGLNLSGGQKQIIAFIRAIFRNPDFLLVDEGTSNMDTGAEKIVINLIKRVKSKMGIMMISHKVNMVKKISDRIYVLDNGSITASGLHENLLKENNLYKRFWDDFY
jgi:ABC-type bacteriocin/lantibiotic exporter with double-glycine peptidase domain